ncbi:MAG: alanine racemase [Acidobacteriota bacterium]
MTMRIDDLDTPSLVVDLDVLENNVRSLASYCRKHGLKLRPHTKTHKIPAIAKLQLEAGSPGITVAKVGEAEVMAEAGLDDILIAYPVLGRPKLERLTALARECQLAVALDSRTALEGVGWAAKEAGRSVDVLVEFDAGVGRCGVASPAEVVSLAKAATALPGLRFRGILFFMGLLGSGESDPTPVLEGLSRKIESIQKDLQREGLQCVVVSGGNTPMAHHSHEIRGLTEIRSGTYVFNDMNTVNHGACRLTDCALQVVVTVVSNAVPGRAMVDGGSKTFSSDRLSSGSQQGFGYVTQHAEVLFTSMNEEHGYLDLRHSSWKPEVGEKLNIIPNHVCTCVNMHDQIFYHRKGEVLGSWIVEGRGKVR